MEETLRQLEERIAALEDRLNPPLTHPPSLPVRGNFISTLENSDELSDMGNASAGGT